MSVTVNSEFVIRLKIELLSDSHIGTGQGQPGGLDRLVHRDQHGLAYIPAKNLWGTMRDRFESVAEELDHDLNKGAWSAWIESILGTQATLVSAEDTKSKPSEPSPSILELSDAKLLDKTRHALVGMQSKPLNAQCFTVRRMNSIDPNTKQSRTDFFRSFDMIRAGLVFQADLSIKSQYAGSLNLKAQKLFAEFAAIAFAENFHLGAMRRHGPGKCRVSVQKLVNDSWDLVRPDDCFAEWTMNAPNLDIIAVAEVNKSIPDAPKSSSADQELAKKTQEWHEIELKLDLDQAVVVSEVNIGNTVRSLDFIPGHFLLGVVCGAIGKLGCDPCYWIDQGAIQVLPAYPAVANKRALPVPLCIVKKKTEAGLPLSSSLSKKPQIAPCDSRGSTNLLIDRDAQGRPYKSGYWLFESNDQWPIYHSVPMHFETHNVVDDNAQRPTSDIVGVYSFEAIAANQSFQSVIRIRDDLWQAFSSSQTAGFKFKLPERLRLGRAKKTQYGRVRLSVTSQRSSQCQESDFHATKDLVVYLATDTIVTNDLGRQEATMSAFIESLSQISYLGEKLDIKADDDEDKGYEGFCRGRRLDSWHVRWCLPRQSLMCLRAGSVIRIKLNSEISANFLQHLQNNGIGSRRAEGFGQIQVNPPWISLDFTEEMQFTHLSASTSASQLTQAQFEADRALRPLILDSWRRQIEIAAEYQASQISIPQSALGITKTLPSNAQLGLLRGVLVQDKDLESCQQWLTALNSRNRKKETWPKESPVKIGELLTKSDKIWELLTKIPPGDAHMQALIPDLVNSNAYQAETAETIKNELRSYAVKTFLMFCIRVVRRRRNQLKGSN